MKTMRLACMVAWVLLGLFLFGIAGGVVVGQARAAEAATSPGQTELAPAKSVHTGMLGMSAAVVMGLACLGAGYAVAHVGAAAMGVLAEKPELIGRVLIFVGLAEGIAIYGLIVAIMLLRMM